MAIKRKHIIIICLVLAIATVAIAVGATSAIWAGEGGAGEYTPQIPAVDWNVWAKYFEFEATADNGARLTSFEGAALKDLIIPRMVKSADNTPVRVTEISNSILSDTTLKEQITSIVIPVSETIESSTINYVGKIDEMTFANLPNLVRVEFSGSGTVEIGDFAFVGCSALKEIVLSGGAKLSLTDADGNKVTISSSDADIAACSAFMMCADGISVTAV